MAITIRSNHQYNYEPCRWYDLPPKQQEWFDYLTTDDERCSYNFIQYRGVWYDLSQFQHNGNLPEDSPLTRWQGHQSDSFSSGVVCSWDDAFEYVKMGTFFCGSDLE